MKASVRYAANMARNALQQTGEDDLSAHRSKAGTPKYFLSTIVRIKNEGRFLPEFIAYHSLLGVEHFYFYNNNSEDDPHTVLAPFMDAGLVTIIDWTPVPASPGCYRHFMKHHAFDSQWIAFLDADEYMVEKREGLLIERLRSAADDCPALALNWRYFGSSHHEMIPEGLLIEHFTMADAQDDTHVKVIARPEHISSYVTSHAFVYRSGRMARSVTGHRVIGSHNLAGLEAPLRINHYVYRARENYLAKAGMGYVDKEGYKYKARSPDKSDLEFDKHNEAPETYLADTYVSRVRAMLEEHGFATPYV